MHELEIISISITAIQSKRKGTVHTHLLYIQHTNIYTHTRAHTYFAATLRYILIASHTLSATKRVLANNALCSFTEDQSERIYKDILMRKREMLNYMFHDVLILTFRK